MDRLFKWNMLITSFTPLWFSLMIIITLDMLSSCFISWTSFFNTKWPEIALLFLIAISLFVGILGVSSFVRNKGKPNEQSGIGKVIRARKSRKLSTDFLLSYILPMIAFDFITLEGIILFLIYFSVLAFLSIRNNSVYTNVIFEFIGFKMYDCDIECQVVGQEHQYNDCIVISRENLTSKINYEFPYFDFDNDIYFNLSRIVKGE